MINLQEMIKKRLFLHLAAHFSGLLLCFWTLSFEVSFEQAKIMFLDGFMALGYILNLQIYSKVFIKS